MIFTCNYTQLGNSCPRKVFQRGPCEDKQLSATLLI
jgi:hypothetical protein